MIIFSHPYTKVKFLEREMKVFLVTATRYPDTRYPDTRYPDTRYPDTLAGPNFS